MWLLMRYLKLHQDTLIKRKCRFSQMRDIRILINQRLLRMGQSLRILDCFRIRIRKIYCLISMWRLTWLIMRLRLSRWRNLRILISLLLIMFLTWKGEVVERQTCNFNNNKNKKVILLRESSVSKYSQLRASDPKKKTQNQKWSLTTTTQTQ